MFGFAPLPDRFDKFGQAEVGTFLRAASVEMMFAGLISRCTIQWSVSELQRIADLRHDC